MMGRVNGGREGIQDIGIGKKDEAACCMRLRL